MKRLFLVLAAVAGLAAAVRADNGGVHSRFDRDASAPESLWAWNDPVPWRAGIVVGRAVRKIKVGRVDCDWTADSAEAVLAVAPWGWVELYGRAGGNRAHLERGAFSARTDVGAGGALGLKLNVWEIGPEHDTAAWRVTIGLQGEYAWRTGKERHGMEAEWGETYFCIPVNYHLSFHGTQRSSYATEAHALDMFVGPACSLLDGEWTENGTDFSFREHQAWGFAGGLRIWLVPSLGIEGALAWFDSASYLAGVQYRF